MQEYSNRYRRRDIQGGYITDKDDIAYFKTIQRNDVIENRMLGDFNNVGSYVISKPILAELIKLNKIYVDTQQNIIFSESVKFFENRALHFALSILVDSPEKGKLTATLELLEEVSRVNGYFKNTNRAIVGSYVSDNTARANKEILEYFNIKPKDSGAQKVEVDEDYLNIIGRLDALNKLNNLYHPLNMRAEKDLFNKKMKILTNAKNSNTLIEEFNKQVFHVQDKFLDKNNKDYYRHLNQILDIVLENNPDKLVGDKKTIKDLRNLQKEYFNHSNKIYQVSLNKMGDFEKSNLSKEAELSEEVRQIDSINLGNQLQQKEPPKKEQKNNNLNENKEKAKIKDETKVEYKNLSKSNKEKKVELEKEVVKETKESKDMEDLSNMIEESENQLAKSNNKKSTAENLKKAENNEEIGSTEDLIQELNK